MRRRSIGLLALGLLAGCGSASGDSSVIRVDDGTTVISNSDSWPEGLPDYARPYPGSKVTTSFAGSTDGTKRGGMVAFTTADAPERVVAFYRDEVKRAGLGEVATMASAGAQMFSASDTGSKRSLSIQAGPDGGATAVTLSYGVEG